MEWNFICLYFQIWKSKWLIQWLKYHDYPLSTKLFGLTLEPKISEPIKDNIKRAKGEADFRNQHAITNHPTTLRLDYRDKKNKIPYVVLMILEKYLTICLEIRNGKH